MKPLFAVAAMLVSLAASAQDSDLAGRYTLQGAAEARSEMLLKADGTFDWRMAYGEIEFNTKGTWSARDGKATLVTDHNGIPNFRLFTDQEYKYVRNAEPGTWVALLALPSVGPLPDVEVQFESASGKTVTAISPHNGYTIVKMADGEQWKRVGLRKKASTAPYQWIDVPSTRAAERLAGFTVTNHETLMPAPFETLVLTRKGADLVMGSETGGTAIYRKN